MIKKTIFFLVLISLNGCTRDDICPEGTPTTPLLIITFKDNSNPLLAKPVTNLSVVTADIGSAQVIAPTTTDSIAVPLKAGADLTAYRFTKDTGGDFPNTDILTFSYTREDLYVNRACSFKTVYDSLEADLQNEGTANWILDMDPLTTRIENENEAHIVILH